MSLHSCGDQTSKSKAGDCTMMVMNASWPIDKSNEERFEKKPRTFSHRSMLRIAMQISTKPVTVQADSLTLRPISHTSGDGGKVIFPPHK